MTQRKTETILINEADWSTQRLNIFDQYGGLMIISDSCGDKTTLLKSILAEAQNKGIPAFGLVDPMSSIPDFIRTDSSRIYPASTVCVNPLRRPDLSQFSKTMQDYRFDFYQGLLNLWLQPLVCEDLGNELDNYCVEWTLKWLIRVFFDDSRTTTTYQNGTAPTLADLLDFSTQETVRTMLIDHFHTKGLSTIQKQLRGLLDSPYGKSVLTSSPFPVNASQSVLVADLEADSGQSLVMAGLFAILVRLLEVPRSVFFIDGCSWFNHIPGVAELVERLCGHGYCLGIQPVLCDHGLPFPSVESVRGNLGVLLIGSVCAEQRQQLELQLQLPERMIPCSHSLGTYSTWLLLNDQSYRGDLENAIYRFYPNDPFQAIPVADLPMQLALVPQFCFKATRFRLPFWSRSRLQTGLGWSLVPTEPGSIELLHQALQATGNVTDQASVCLGRGTILLGLGDYEAAITELNHALRHNPNDEIACLTRAIAHAALGQYSEAISDYTQVLAVNPSQGIAHTNRGWSYVAVGEYQKALNDFDQVLQSNDKLVAHHINWGYCHFCLGNTLVAICSLNSAITLLNDIYTTPKDFRRRALKQNRFPNTWTPHCLENQRLRLNDSSPLIQPLELLFAEIVALAVVLPQAVLIATDLEDQRENIAQEARVQVREAIRLTHRPDTAQQAESSVGKLIDLETHLEILRDQHKKASVTIQAEVERLWEVEHHLSQHRERLVKQDRKSPLIGFVSSIQGYLRPKPPATSEALSREEAIQQRLAAIKQRK